MKKLNKNQWIAVISGMALLGYLLFSNIVIDLFNLSTMETTNPTPQGGIVVTEVSVGSGVQVKPGDVLTVHYVGTLADGRVFDSSLDRNSPFTFTLGVGQVIRGWDEGLAGMRVGGRRTLIISPEYGYGSQAAGPIPPNSTLRFEVQLLNAVTP